MRSTLLYIPHADPLWNIPVFGYGWLLMLVAVIGVAVIGYGVYRHGWSRTAWADLPILLVFAAVVGWAAPLLEQPSSTGPPLGIPIRAYGVMVLLGISAGIVMSVQQARRMGVNPEVVFSICFWIIVAGFVGARTLLRARVLGTVCPSDFSRDSSPDHQSHGWRAGGVRQLHRCRAGLRVATCSNTNCRCWPWPICWRLD